MADFGHSIVGNDSSLNKTKQNKSSEAREIIINSFVVQDFFGSEDIFFYFPRLRFSRGHKYTWYLLCHLKL